MEETHMDPVWKDLPVDLVNHVCNQLPKVRVIPENLRDEIVKQHWMLDNMLNYYIVWYGVVDAYFVLLDDLNIMTTHEYFDLIEAWDSIDSLKRMEYYRSVMN